MFIERWKEEAREQGIEQGLLQGQAKALLTRIRLKLACGVANATQSTARRSPRDGTTRVRRRDEPTRWGPGYRNRDPPGPGTPRRPGR